MKDPKFTLKTARQYRNLTQEEAAKLIGISKDTLSNYERGKTFPDVLTLKQIEKAYQMSYDSLIFLPLSNG